MLPIGPTDSPSTVILSYPEVSQRTTTTLSPATTSLSSTVILQVLTTIIGSGIIGLTTGAGIIVCAVGKPEVIAVAVTGINTTAAKIPNTATAKEMALIFLIILFLTSILFINSILPPTQVTQEYLSLRIN